MTLEAEQQVQRPELTVTSLGPKGGAIAPVGPENRLSNHRGFFPILKIEFTLLGFGLA